MTLNTDWDYIVNTDEYQDDLAKLTKITVDALGIEEYVDNTNPFIYGLSNLMAVRRYFSRHLPEIVDIDETPFLDLIRQETGFDLPLSSDLPIIEWLRESKSWFGHRGSLNIYPFIGALVGSPLEINFPARLIARWDTRNTFLDGEVTAHGGKRPFSLSKRARIRDGIRWAQYVYFVNVLEAQNIINLTDLDNLLANVHPAGTKRFVYYQFNHFVDVPDMTFLSYAMQIDMNYYIRPQYPTLDNGLLADDPGSQWDMHFAHGFIANMVVDDLEKFEPLAMYRQLPYDTLTNIYVGTRTYAGVQREVYNPATEEYDQLFSDNDTLVYTNVTTNMGISSYSYLEVNEMSFRQLQDVAYNNDQKNMQGQNWMPDLLYLDVTVE